MTPQRKSDRSQAVFESVATVVPADGNVTMPTSAASPALMLQTRLERTIFTSLQSDPAEVANPASGAVAIILVAAVLGWASALWAVLLVLG